MAARGTGTFRVVRACTGVLVLAGVSLLHAIELGPMLGSLSVLLSPDPDPIAVYERRVAVLRPELSGHTVVGYLAAVPPEEIGRDPGTAARFYLTQYALAPVLVITDATLPLVVADLASTPRPVVPAQLRVARDVGNGLVLLRPRDP